MKVESWPDLQRELQELRARFTVLSEQLRSTTAAYDDLVAERAQWADQARSLEASEADVARLRGKVAELEGSGAALSGEELRRAAALEARNQQLDSRSEERRVGKECRL